LYSIRPVLNIPELQDDIAAVSTTKFIIPAADFIPTPENTRTNGLPLVPISVHGKIDIITVRAPI